jgi:hypothetical protein
MDARECLAETAHDQRGIAANNVIGRAKSPFALKFRLAKRGGHFIVGGQERPTKSSSSRLARWAAKGPQTGEQMTEAEVKDNS